jgi:hypothetical protein
MLPKKEMKEFPPTLKTENKDNFAKINHERLKCYLRRDLYEHIISHTENEYFSLDDFNRRVGNMEKTNELIDELIPELTNLGWKCQKAYGDTGLFIYSTEKPPANCWF